MISLRSLSISRRLLLILVASVLMLTILSILMLSQIHRDLYTAKTEKTQQLVEAATGFLAFYHEQEISGRLTREQAQAQAKDAIRGLRYKQVEYFWINDLMSVMIMHPMKPNLEGQDVSNIVDPDGLHVFNKAAEIAKNHGSGPLQYRWSKTGTSEPVGKISYVNLFSPWGWVIGTGVYVDDLENEFKKQVWEAAIASISIILLIAVLIMIISRSIVRPLNETVEAMANIASGDSDLTQTLVTSGRDEVTALAIHFNSFANNMREIVGLLLQGAAELGLAATELGQTASRAQLDSEDQWQQMDLVATAMNEVTYAVQDVAKNAESATAEMQDAKRESENGRLSIEKSVNEVTKLSSIIANAVCVIETLSLESLQIGAVLEVIRSIAEQTNLLALNAAIEAARAGDQGRGFAVVADEVRLLAQRTQKSTLEIQQMIERLQSHSVAAVKAITDSNQVSQQTIVQATLAGESLNAISHTLLSLTQINESVASATLQQSHAVDDINRNVARVAILSQNTASAAERVSIAGGHLDVISNQLNDLLGRFRI